MVQTVYQPVLLILYAAAGCISAHYFLSLLQKMDWEPQRYMGILKDESGRWLPLIFILVPAAALFMDYGMFAGEAAAVYLFIVSVWYLPKKKSNGKWTGRMKRLYLLWISCGLLLTFLFHAVFTFSGYIASAVLSAAFLLQPFIPLLLVRIDSPVSQGLEKWYIAYSEDRSKKLLGSRIIALTGNEDTTLLEKALEGMISSSQSCEVVFEPIKTAMDAAGLLKKYKRKNGKKSGYLVCRIDTDTVEEMKRILELVHPDILVQTSADFFSVLDGLKSTAQEGICFVNGDDEVLQQYVGTDRILTYGFKEGNDCLGKLEAVDKTGTQFTVLGSTSTGIPFTTRILGKDAITLLVGAVGVAYCLGISPDTMQKSIASLASEPHHMQMISSGDRIVIDDCANHEEISGEKALDTLQAFSRQEYVKILITTGFLRQGAIQEQSNRRFGEKASEIFDYIILVGEEIAYGLKLGILEAGFMPEHLLETDGIDEALSVSGGLAGNAEQKEQVILLEVPDYFAEDHEARE